MSAGSRVSGRSHSPATPAATATTTNVVNPPAAVQPPRSSGKSGGGLLRRITRHFTTKKSSTPAPPPPVPVPARLAAKLAQPAPVVPAIVQPPSLNPQSRAASRSPTPAGQRPRSKSPAPSTASKNRSPRAPSPDRVSLASWRYPALPPSPVPPSPSVPSPVPQFSPSLSSPLQAFSTGRNSPAPAFARPSESLLPPFSPSPDSSAAAFEQPAPSLAAEPEEAQSTPLETQKENQETVDAEPSKVEPVPAATDLLASPLELEAPAATFPPLPPTPSLVQSDTESSAGHQSIQPLTPTLQLDEEDSQLSRGRRPRRKDTPLLLMVPYGDSDAPLFLVEDNEDAWTDDEGVPTKSKEHLPLIEESNEVPRLCRTPERRPLTVFVPPSGGLAVTVDGTTSPTEMIPGTPKILEPRNEDDDDEYPANPRWSQAPKTGGIEFILPARRPDDAPLLTSQSDKPRSQTLDPNVGGLRPGRGEAVRRSTTFSRILNFGSKKDAAATLSPTTAESERRPSADRSSRRVSIIPARGPSRLEVEASRLPTRAPTVCAMSNAELADQLANLRNPRHSTALGSNTLPVIDDETARVTELAYF
ncbi:hypothetical protein FRB90_009017 [Tulasnella sp. 427]|nr:hypothetical protein FRB90_009017 [Tulasnella sp. 427]